MKIEGNSKNVDIITLKAKEEDTSIRAVLTPYWEQRKINRGRITFDDVVELDGIIKLLSDFRKACNDSLERKKMEKIKEILNKNSRYDGFTLLDKPQQFNEMFAKQNFRCVNAHSVQLCSGEEDIVGFCGAFEWNNGILEPLDGDTYNEGMYVLGYEITTRNGIQELDILVGDDW